MISITVSTSLSLLSTLNLTFHVLTWVRCRSECHSLAWCSLIYDSRARSSCFYCLTGPGGGETGVVYLLLQRASFYLWLESYFTGRFLFLASNCSQPQRTHSHSNPLEVLMVIFLSHFHFTRYDYLRLNWSIALTLIVQMELGYVKLAALHETQKHCLSDCPRCVRWDLRLVISCLAVNLNKNCVLNEWVRNNSLRASSSLSFTCDLIDNFHTTSFELVTSIPPCIWMLSLSLFSKCFLTWMGFNLSKEWFCCVSDDWWKVRKRKRENKTVREIKRNLWKKWLPNLILKIGIQLQMIPAYSSAMLQNSSNQSI